MGCRGVGGFHEYTFTLEFHGVQPVMKTRAMLCGIATLGLCYIISGLPELTDLIKPAVIWQGMALKSITYHWENYSDRLIPARELLASRFYVLIIAAVSFSAGIISVRSCGSSREIIFLMAIGIGLLILLVYAQSESFYTYG